LGNYRTCNEKTAINNKQSLFHMAFFLMVINHYT
jgi:hypothetical protein